MVAFSVTAISRDAVVSRNSLPSTEPQRVNAQASTMAKRPNKKAVSSRKAIKRSPNRANRYRPGVRAAPAAAALVSGTAVSTTPDSSSRYWPGGIAFPQLLHRLEYTLVRVWQNGHSIRLTQKTYPPIYQSIPPETGTL